MDPILIGYFPKRRSKFPAGWGQAGVSKVTEIASLAHYTSGGPANWIQQYRHNEMWFFDSEVLARKVIYDAIQIDIEPDPQHDPPWRIDLNHETGHKYDFYAYKMFPCCFVDGRQEDFVMPSLNCEPLPDDYVRLGYDAVNRTGCPHFECGPLFCNGMADEIEVNRFCLIDEPQRALEVARYFSERKPEPGTYFAVEVWRKTTPARELAP
jgi:hypothetical protein